jgi:hypothetical protein
MPDFEKGPQAGSVSFLQAYLRQPLPTVAPYAGISCMALLVIRFGEVPEPHGISDVTVRQSPFVVENAAGVFRPLHGDIVGSVCRRRGRERVRTVTRCRTLAPIGSVPPLSRAPRTNWAMPCLTAFQSAPL